MTLAVVLCMTVFSVTAYAGGDMVDSTMGDPTMESPTATTQPENTNTGEQTPNGQTLTVLVTENADGSHTVTIMCIYQSDSRSGLIAALTEMRGYLDEDEAQLRELTDSALQKLGEITDEDFAELELVPDFDTDE